MSDGSEIKPVFQAENLQRQFVDGQNTRVVLSGVDLSIRRGEFVVVMGESGSGKSTLLSILGLLDSDYAGRLEVFGRDARSMDERDRGDFRNAKLAFVFQSFHLLPHLTVLENVMLPGLFRSSDEIGEPIAKRALEQVNLAEFEKMRPSQLSGGQKQRVAFARAWAQSAEVLLCDEPTGNLDESSADAILRMLQQAHGGEKKTILVVTHSEKIAAVADRVLHLRRGKLST